jgi:glutamate synthase domain-containing protein 3
VVVVVVNSSINEFAAGLTDAVTYVVDDWVESNPLVRTVAPIAT